jgi:hypothetical protein
VSARASERSAKPTQGHAHRTTVETKKASSRVDEQLAKNKDQSHHAKSGIGHHPGRAKHDPVATAASAGGAGFRDPFAPPLSAFARSLKLVGPAQSFEIGDIAGETGVEASVPGVRFEVDPSTGDLTVRAGSQKVLTVSLSVLNSHAVEIAEALHTAFDKVKNGATITQVVDGHPVTFTASKDGVSVSGKSHGVTTTVTLNPLGQLVISLTGTASIPSRRVPGSSEAVNLAVTTILTPTRPFGEPPSGLEPQKVAEPGRHVAPHHSWVHDAGSTVLHGLADLWNAPVHFVEHVHIPPAPPWLRNPFDQPDG